jgi:hypothetical protein
MRRPAVSDHAAMGRVGSLPEVIAVDRSHVDRFRAAPGLNPRRDLALHGINTGVESRITLFMLRAVTHRRRGERQRSGQSAKRSARSSFSHVTLLPRWRRAEHARCGIDPMRGSALSQGREGPCFPCKALPLFVRSNYSWVGELPSTRSKPRAAIAMHRGQIAAFLPIIHPRSGSERNSTPQVEHRVPSGGPPMGA